MYFLSISPVVLLSWVTPHVAGAGWMYLFVTPITLGVILLALYIMARFSVLVPAAALEHRPTIKWAWMLTHGEGIRLFVMVMLLPWFFSFLIDRLPWPDEYRTISSILYLLLWVILLSIEVAMLSLAYRELRKDQEQAGNTV